MAQSRAREYARAPRKTKGAGDDRAFAVKSRAPRRIFG